MRKLAGTEKGRQRQKMDEMSWNVGRMTIKLLFEHNLFCRYPITFQNSEYLGNFEVEHPCDLKK